jgi:hypothetical protein
MTDSQFDQYTLGAQRMPPHSQSEQLASQSSADVAERGSQLEAAAHTPLQQAQDGTNQGMLGCVTLYCVGFCTLTHLFLHISNLFSPCMCATCTWRTVLGCWLCHKLPTKSCITLSRRLENKQQLEDLLDRLTHQGAHAEMGQDFCGRNGDRVRRNLTRILKRHFETAHKEEYEQVCVA